MENKKTKILIVDDEEDFCYFLKQNLESTGAFEVTTCSQSTEAFGIAQQLQPALIFLDIMMPQKDGFTLLRELRASEKTWATPIVMLTAKGDSRSVFEGQRYLATDYIIKPFEREELLECIRKNLRSEG